MSEGGSRDQNKFIIRMPEGLRERIKAHADEHSRSMNAHIVYMLENALFQADYERVKAGLEPLGKVPQDDLDRMHLFIEDNERRETNRSKVLTEQGIAEMLAAINDRVSRLEKTMDPNEDAERQSPSRRKGAK